RTPSPADSAASARAWERGSSKTPGNEASSSRPSSTTRTRRSHPGSSSTSSGTSPGATSPCSGRPRATLGLTRPLLLGEELALRGGRAGAATAGPTEREREPDGENRPGQRTRDVDPVVGEVAADEIGPERAGRIHRGARDRTAPQPGERDVATHTERAED